jgi:hypothetical protein
VLQSNLVGMDAAITNSLWEINKGKSLKKRMYSEGINLIKEESTANLRESAANPTETDCFELVRRNLAAAI